MKRFDGEDNAAFYATVSKNVKSNYSSQIRTFVNCTLPRVKNWPEAICNQDFCIKKTGREETLAEIKIKCTCKYAGRESEG